MIDDRDITKLKEVFATKEDLNRFAAKEEFGDLKNEVIGLKSEVTGLKGEVVGLKEEMVEVKFEIAELKNRIDHFETSLTHKIDVQADRLAGLITDFLDESLVASAQDEERDQKLENHEKRLQHLEVKPA